MIFDLGVNNRHSHHKHNFNEARKTGEITGIYTGKIPQMEFDEGKYD